MLNMWKRSVALVVILLLTLSTVPAASAEVPFVGMGDSIGEGVQSGDASESTQPFNFLNLIALRLGTSFPLPLIRTEHLWDFGRHVHSFPHQPERCRLGSGSERRRCFFDTSRPSRRDITRADQLGNRPRLIPKAWQPDRNRRDSTSQPGRLLDW